jgi:hypothetical protein
VVPPKARTLRSLPVLSLLYDDAMQNISHCGWRKSARATSSTEAAPWIDRAIDLVAPVFEKVWLRGDTQATATYVHSRNFSPTRRAQSSRAECTDTPTTEARVFSSIIAIVIL